MPRALRVGAHGTEGLDQRGVGRADVVAYGCTTGSYHGPGWEALDELERRTGKLVVSSNQARI